FTPNNDGNNDVLFVRSNIIDTMHFIIYNRWGQEVFDSRDINIGWDGTFRGRDLPPDVYGYFLEVTCIDGGTLTIQGNVTLLR
ncbi:MAG: gliding motility-associated C-terminal domain-containing protein, partial [Bacteroidota bacterium]